MAIYTTEITSANITSDNPVHQRLLKAYYIALDYNLNDLLEIGCGEGRGVELLAPKSKSFTAVDKIGEVIRKLSTDHPQHKFIQANIPPISQLSDNQFDTIIAFQVIEHIKDDHLFLKEISRLLKPGGTALITTPNIKKSLTRNPWHIREYTAQQLTELCKKYFSKVEMKGVAGNDKVMSYYEMNRKSVEKITKWDFLNLQYRLPASILRIPYELLNRVNRNKLEGSDDSLVASINYDDYFVSDDADNSLDLLAVVGK